MSSPEQERAKLVETLMRRYQQPTLLDAAEVIKFDKIQEVYSLLELDGKLRAMWWEKRGSVLSEY